MELPLPCPELRFWMEEMTQYAASTPTMAGRKRLPAGDHGHQSLVYLVELTFATSFMWALRRPIAAIAILFVLHIWLGLSSIRTSVP